MALSDGYRESKASWLGVIQDLQARGLKTPPQLAIGAGDLGFWAALDETWPHTRSQCCRVHKTANVLNELPKSIQGKAKTGLHEIWMTETQALAEKAFDRFVRDFGAKYPKAVAILVKDRAVLLTFYDVPAEHWLHIPTTNPIESSFATLRHRTSRAKNCGSRNTLLGLVFQLALTAEKSWRKLSGFSWCQMWRGVVRFQDGIAVADQPGEAEEEQQNIAA